MLLSTHLNKLDSKVDSIVCALSEEQGKLTTELYARLTLKLNEISKNLEEDIKKSIRHINNSYLADKVVLFLISKLITLSRK